MSVLPLPQNVRKHIRAGWDTASLAAVYLTSEASIANLIEHPGAVTEMPRARLSTRAVRRQRNAEIVSRVVAGEKPLTLATEYGVSRSAIYQAIEAARLAGVAVPDFTDGRPRGERAPRASVRVGNKLQAALGQHAARRRIDIATLCRLILNAVADGGLVDAVLDDADEIMEAAE